jgi:hypothetical protein
MKQTILHRAPLPTPKIIKISRPEMVSTPLQPEAGIAKLFEI